MFKQEDIGKIFSPEEIRIKLVEEIISRSKTKDLFMVGISGLDASGKSVLAEELKEALENNGLKVLLVSGDSFQFPPELKNDLVEGSWAEQHYKRTINFQKMVDEFLIPLTSKPEEIKLDLVEFGSGRVINKIVNLNYPLVVIVESIYLLKKSLIEYFDFKVFLDISIETSLSRAKARKRDLELYGDELGVEQKYSKKNFPGYQLYQQLDNPKQSADLVIDANNWAELRLETINLSK
jgi:uridine kinase